MNLTLTLRVEPLSRLQTDGYIFTGPDSWVHTHEYILTGMTYSRVQGLAFPTGMIPAHLAPRVKWEVYKLLVTREGGRDREESFPTARTLLLFDTREFLNVRVSTYAHI